jgi:cysteinyl-tRNA synthetase
VNRAGVTADVQPALAEMLGVIGLEDLLAADAPVDEELLRLAAERDEARLARDFDLADRKRDELRRRGYEVRDTPEGPELVPLRDSG